MPKPIELEPPHVVVPEPQPPVRARPGNLRYGLNGGCAVLFVAPLFTGICAAIVGRDAFGWAFLGMEALMAGLWVRSLPAFRRRRRRRGLQKWLRTLQFTASGDGSTFRGKRLGPDLEIHLEGGTEPTMALRIRACPAPGHRVAEIDVMAALQGRTAIGDGVFDRTLGARTDTPLLRAVLNWPARHQLVREAQEHGVRIEQGAVVVPLIHIKQPVPRAEMGQWAELAARFVVPDRGINDRLAQICRDRAEPPAVRAAAFTRLTRSVPNLLKSMLAERVPQLTVCLGELLGKRLANEMEALGTSGGEPVNQRAFAAWVETMGKKPRAKVLATYVTSEYSGLAATALRLSAAAKLPLPAGAEIGLARRGDAVQRALVEWAERLGDSVAERAAIAVCAHADDAVVLERAVGLLGQIGTLDAITPLVELGAARRDVRREARQALTQIRSRLPNKGGLGDLALLDDEAGTAGGLAIAESGLAVVDEP